MMKVKLESICSKEVSEALKMFGGLKLSPLVAFKFAKVLKCVSEEIQRYETVRISSAEELGELVEESNQYKFSKENGVKFHAQLKELLETEVELPADKLNLNDLGDTFIEPNLLLPLMWLIEE